jgi:hypothetical protein
MNFNAHGCDLHHDAGTPCTDVALQNICKIELLSVQVCKMNAE